MSAQVEEDTYFSGMPVVASVSRLPQRLADAPTSVTVIDREMIRSLPIRDLNDIFRLVPGFQTYPNNTEAARVTYLKRRGVAYDTWIDRGINLAVAEASLKYRRPAKFDDTLQIDFYNGDGTMLGTVKSAAIGEPAGGDVETQAAGIFFAVVRNTGNSNGDFTISVTKL